MNAVIRIVQGLFAGIASGLLFATPAVAGAGWYLGVGAGATSADDVDSLGASDLESILEDVGLTADIDTFSADDSDSGWKVFGGYAFNDYFALEFFYVDMSFFDISVAGTVDDGSGPVGFTFDSGFDPRGFGVYGVLQYPLGAGFSLVGRAGGIHWEADVPISTSIAGIVGDVSIGDDGTDFAWGGGLRYQVTQHLAVEAQYESFDIADTDVELISGSLLWGF